MASRKSRFIARLLTVLHMVGMTNCSDQEIDQLRLESGLNPRYRK